MVFAIRNSKVCKKYYWLSHLSKGEYFILLGQYDRALNELKFALSKVENNFQVTETIFSKMDEIKSLEKNS